MEREPGNLTMDPQKAVKDIVWYKVVGVGNVGVGKTCLIKHFCESKFTAGYQPTVGVDYGFKVHHIQDKDVRVHLWDLSGGAEYADVRNELYHGTDAVFLVYDVTEHASFDSLDIWAREVTKYCTASPVYCLVANKTDLRAKRVVSTVDGRRWATNNRMSYHETSCASGEGVEKMFSDIIQGVYDNKVSNVDS